jgi:hypothetical protein
MKVDGSRKGLLALATTAPASHYEHRLDVYGYVLTLLLVSYTFDIKPVPVCGIEVSSTAGYRLNSVSASQKSSSQSKASCEA